jgi:hypothetical protein
LQVDFTSVKKIYKSHPMVIVWRCGCF